MFLVKKAFNLANFADCRGDAEMSVEEALKQGEQLMEEAIKLFDEVQDFFTWYYRRIVTSIMTEMLIYKLLKKF